MRTKKNSKITVIYSLVQKNSTHFASFYTDEYLHINFESPEKLKRQLFFETIKIQRHILKLKSILHPFNNRTILISIYKMLHVHL